MAKMQPVLVPRTLAAVVSREEAARLIAAVRNLKHQIALSVAYGAGLRASEVVGLKISDVCGHTVRAIDTRVYRGEYRE
jgi:integrase/recombinase XerD